MAFYGLWLEYALEGNSKYIDWRDIMEFVLEDNGLKELVYQDIPQTTTLDAQNMAEWKKCVLKAS